MDHADEDDEAIQRHLKGLNLEWKKKNKSIDKIVRLFSLTHKYRSALLLEKSTTSRVTAALEEYPMIRKPIYVRLHVIISLYVQCICNSNFGFTSLYIVSTRALPVSRRCFREYGGFER